MLSRIFLLCALAALCADGLPLGCRWMEHKFREHNRECVTLLEAMASNSTNSTEDEDAISFPNELYSRASEAPAEDTLRFIVQVLDEMADLFDEDRSAVSWEESTEDALLTLLHRQAHSLSACFGGEKRKNKKLHHYFKRLSHQILEQMSHSAEAWELLRKELQAHLQQVDRLAVAFTRK